MEINNLLSLLNEDKTDLYDLNIFFTGDFELNFDNNNAPMLWRNTEFWGIYNSYFEDLIEHGGLHIDNKIYEVVSYEYQGITYE